MAARAVGSLLRRPVGRPLVIAHGAGNTRESAREAAAGPADLIEVDLWAHGDRLEARHERAIYPLPFLAERWYLRRAPRRPFELVELLEEVGPERSLLLDLKNGTSRAARLLHQALAGSPGARVVASSQSWSLLRTIQRELPGVETLYSIDVQAKLDLFLSIARRPERPAGVSCRHGLLTEPVVERLRSDGFRVVAWTVDDPERASELDGWGIDGITAHRAAALVAALER